MISGLTLPRWIHVLLSIYQVRDEHRYAEKLIRKVKGSRSHLREIISLLEEHKIITIGSNSKIKNITLTDKGLKIVKAAFDIQQELQNTENGTRGDFKSTGNRTDRH